jgi:hypothetical protein
MKKDIQNRNMVLESLRSNYFLGTLFCFVHSLCFMGAGRRSGGGTGFGGGDFGGSLEDWSCFLSGIWLPHEMF